MRFYRIEEAYITYLRQFDSKIYSNKGATRPYIGVVLKVWEYHYYVPLSSPKEKHKKMKNSADFHKIRQIKGGQIKEYGVINFSMMLPVPKEVLIEMDIRAETDGAYRDILMNQYVEILGMAETIEKKAKKLYELCVMKHELTPHETNIKQRCCDFLLLEEKMVEYNGLSQEV